MSLSEKSTSAVTSEFLMKGVIELSEQSFVYNVKRTGAKPKPVPWGAPVDDLNLGEEDSLKAHKLSPIHYKIHN